MPKDYGKTRIGLIRHGSPLETNMNSYRLNRPDESNFMAARKPMLIEFGIHYGLKSCVHHSRLKQLFSKTCQLQKIWSHFSHNFVSLSNGKNSAI